MCDVLSGVPGCVTKCDRREVGKNWPKIAWRTLWKAPKPIKQIAYTLYFSKKFKCLFPLFSFFSLFGLIAGFVHFDLPFTNPSTSLFIWPLCTLLVFAIKWSWFDLTWLPPTLTMMQRTAASIWIEIWGIVTPSTPRIDAYAYTSCFKSTGRSLHLSSSMNNPCYKRSSECIEYSCSYRP